MPGLPNELREIEGMLGLIGTQSVSGVLGVLVKSSSMFEWLEAASLRAEKTPKKHRDMHNNE